MTPSSPPHTPDNRPADRPDAESATGAGAGADVIPAIIPAIIPYDADAVTAAQVIRGADGGVGYRLPSVRVTPGETLRLNSGQFVFGEPPPLAELPAVADQLAFLAGHFRRQCGVFAKPARAFVDAYMAYVAAEVAAHADALAAGLARFGDLYRPEHWAFSAPRPLPRAHLPAPRTPGEPPPDGLVAVAVAFWTAAGAVAIEPVGGATRTPADSRRRDRLAAAGIRVVEIPAAALAPGGAAAAAELAARLPDDFRAFWRGQALPSGPFKGAAALPDLPPPA